MTRHQVILVIASLAAVVLIYQLPRVVVENETVTEVKSHDFSISSEDEQLFLSLRQQLTESTEIKKSVNFADSLAWLSLKYRLIDSAARYAEKIMALDTSRFAKTKAGLIYYESFQTAEDQLTQRGMAEMARGIFEELLKEDPLNSSLKNKLAMTYMISKTPMAGVALLREVLANDPENRETLLNLGLLAIRSGQYDKAIERFKTLLQIDSTDDESMFYLGMTHIEAGDSAAGKGILKRLVEKEGADVALKATASTYLKEL